MKKVLFIPVAALAVALSVSACGDSKDDAGVAAASSGASVPATPAGGETGAAAGNGGQTSNGGGGKLTPAQREMLTKLRDCMIKKGYGMPEVSADNPVMAPSDKKGRSDEQVNKDAGECLAQNAPKLPSPPPGG